MKNVSCPARSPKAFSPLKTLAQLARIRFFAALSALGLTFSVTPEASAEDLIPYCSDLSGYKAPEKSVFLNGEEEGIIYCAVDGDTFDVILRSGEGIVRVRLWGVDCPESSNNSKCRRQGCDPKKGKRTADQVRALLGDGDVTLQPPYRNNGNRKLAYVKLKNGTDLGRQMVRQCLCQPGYEHQRKQTYQRDGRQCGW